MLQSLLVVLCDVVNLFALLLSNLHILLQDGVDEPLDTEAVVRASEVD